MEEICDTPAELTASRDPGSACARRHGRQSGETEISRNSWNIFRKNRFYLFLNKVDWNGRHETPAGNASPGETPQARSVEEAPGPPAESECLEWKSTFEFYKQKNIRNMDSIY